MASTRNNKTHTGVASGPGAGQGVDFGTQSAKRSVENCALGAIKAYLLKRRISCSAIGSKLVNRFAGETSEHTF